MSTDHVVVSEEPMQLHCRHCESSYQVNMPCPAPLLVAIIEKFVYMHEDCEGEDD